MKKLWFVALPFVVVALYLGYVMLKPRDAGPVVNASHLPASCSALNARVSLVKVLRTGKHTLHAHVIIKYKHIMPHFADPVATVNGRAIDHGGCDVISENYLGYAQKIELDIKIKTPSRNGSLNLSLPVYYYGEKQISFKNISPTKLPITQKYGTTEVTIERAYVGTLPNPGNWYEAYPESSRLKPGMKLFIVDLKCRAHTSRIDGHVKVDSFSVSCTGTTENPWSVSSPSFTNGEGTSFATLASRDEELSASADVFMEKANHWTTMETLASEVNKRLATKMITSRAMSAANAAGDLYKHSFAVDTSGKLPKQFNFNVDIKMPPSPDQQATVTFTNIRIP